MLTEVSIIDAREDAPQSVREPSQSSDLHRFVVASIAGFAAASIPYLYVLWDLWNGSVNIFRSVSPANLYDLQAEAMLHGHLWVPKGSIGVEGFIHDGRTYTYFGLIPSLLRVPILLVVPHASGHLTAPSMLLAWLATGLFSSLLIWRVRVLIRSQATLGRGEATTLGVLMATIMGGSVLVFLASSPWVYDEDLAWSVPVTLATLFALLGVLDRPSRKRVVVLAGFLAIGVLGRVPPALACIAGAFLVALWFRFGPDKMEERRWALPVALSAVIPIALLGAVNWLKFGSPLNSLPLGSQVWTHLNAHRRLFLLSTGQRGYSLHFLPTTLWAYLQPFGIHLQTTFPYIAPPAQSPHVFGGYIFDALYPTQSATASMPLLFILSCCGLVACFRPSATRSAKLLRIPFIVAIGATAVDFIYGYIAPRYLGDFVPFLVIGSAAGAVEIWRRLSKRGSTAKWIVTLLVIGLGILSVAINVGIALSPTTGWSQVQAANYVKTVMAMSNATGHPLSGQIKHVSSLPYSAPTNQIDIVGDCSGAYLSTGQSVSYAPGLQIQHESWDVIDQGPGIHHTVEVSFNGPVQPGTTIPILTHGDVSLVIHTLANNHVLFGVQNPHPPRVPWPPVIDPVVAVKPHGTYKLEVWTDPNLNRITVWWEKPDGKVVTRTDTYLPSQGSTVIHSTEPSSTSPLPAITVRDVSKTPLEPRLCRELLDQASTDEHP
jgi:hypothetical protein